MFASDGWVHFERLLLVYGFTFGQLLACVLLVMDGPIFERLLLVYGSTFGQLLACVLLVMDGSIFDRVFVLVYGFMSERLPERERGERERGKRERELHSM